MSDDPMAAVKKIALGVLASMLTGAVGYLLLLPTRVALIEERSAVISSQQMDVVELIDALHPRGSALAGGGVEYKDAAAALKGRMDQIRRRAEAIVANDDDSAAGHVCPVCVCPEPTPCE